METRPQALAVFSSHYYIKKGYQSRMILKFCLLTVAGGVLYCALFYTSLDREIGGGYLQALEGMRFVRHSMFRTFVFSEGAMMLVLGTAVVVTTMLMSHRIAGPLWRIEHTARAVAKGDLVNEIHLRKKDEIRPLADQMNMMIRDMRARVTDINLAYKILDSDIAMLKARSRMGDLTTDESAALTRNIKDASKTLLARLSEIKTR